MIVRWQRQLTGRSAKGPGAERPAPPPLPAEISVEVGTTSGNLHNVTTDRVSARGIVLLCGRSFSGKSTVAAQAVRRLDADVISLDAINAERNLRSGAGLPIEEWAKTFDMAQSRARALLESGTTVIIDDTSSPRFLRGAWRRLAAEAEVSLVLVYVNTPVDVSLKRHAANRAARSRADVDDAVLREHLESFEPPTPDEDPVCHSTVDGNLADTLDQLERRLVANKTAR